MVPIDSDAGGRGIPVGGSYGLISASSEIVNVRGKNLREGSNITLRPAVLTSAHLYNLRNQGWGLPHPNYTDSGLAAKDPIELFHAAGSRFPSNSDSVNGFLYPNTGSSGDKDIERFNAMDAVKNPLGSSPAAQGFFIIDALERGQSRKDNIVQLNTQYAGSIDNVDASNLPIDKTPGGASVVCEYSGRVFFAGFSGSIQSGDQNSPRMSSYILFSQLVQDVSNINICYQSADPTNKDDSSLVDTDGGFIRLEGAYDIKQMVNVGSGLIVFATNGVWMVSGDDGSGFKATSYKTSKLTNSGCISSGSVVVTGNSVLYWSSDGIYNIGPNQFGDYIADRITRKTIQSFYNDIDPADAALSEGVYDSYENKVKWIFGNRPASTDNTYELILDLTLGSFYPFIIQKLGGNRFPMAVKGVLTNPFKLSDNVNQITVGGVQVNDSGVAVTVTDRTASSEVKEVKYLTITGTSPHIKYAFSTYHQTEHYDWKSIDGVGVDAKSFLLTGTFSGGDFQRRKDAPYITFHFNKTEDGFTTVNGDLVLTNPSSCLVQAQWDWSDSINSGRWSTPFQAYRFNRVWLPSDASSKFDNGYYVVQTKTRLRGAGKVLSIYISSEPGKHLDLLGWSMVINANSNV